jgi:hypothetical protein
VDAERSGVVIDARRYLMRPILRQAEQYGLGTPLPDPRVAEHEVSDLLRAPGIPRGSLNRRAVGPTLKPPVIPDITAPNARSTPSGDPNMNPRRLDTQEAPKVDAGPPHKLTPMPQIARRDYRTGDGDYVAYYPPGF